jgi:GntR family transcriptional regulator, transcriptional repressor for pyruvate dehydrogenase complex
MPSTSRITPVPRRSTIEGIVRSLHEYIVDGEAVAGSELPPERELARALGVSRFSLREALRVAQAQGLVDIRRGRRPRVAVPSPDAAAEVIGLTLRRTKGTLLHLAAAREALESQIARVAAATARAADLRRLQDNVRRMEQESSDLEACAARDLEFHSLILKASRNPVFEVMLAPVAALLKESRTRTLRLTGVQRAIEGHRQILLRVQEGDGEGAARAMRRHLAMAEEDLRRSRG